MLQVPAAHTRAAGIAHPLQVSRAFNALADAAEGAEKLRQGLAAAHGGTAEVAGEPGQGATFTGRPPAQAHTGTQPLPHRFFTAAS